jgi:hypothetical protein
VGAQCVYTIRLQLKGGELDRPTETKDLECMIKTLRAATDAGFPTVPPCCVLARFMGFMAIFS